MISKEKRLEKLQAKREELLAQLKPLEKEITRNYTLINNLRIEIDREKIEEGEYDWGWLLHEDGINVSNERYNLCNDKLTELGFRASGYYTDTLQRDVKISLNKNESINKSLNGLLEILPFIKWRDNNSVVNKAIGRKGNLRTKRVGIFEHTLSEDGVYYLVFPEGFDCVYLMIDRYHVTSMVRRFTTLMDALHYISERHYYEIAESNSSRIE